MSRTSASPLYFVKRDMMPWIVLPHWLSATKLWKTSKTTSLRSKYSPFPAFFSQYQAMVFSGLAVRPLSISVEPRVDPCLERVEQLPHVHVVLVDDLLQWVSIGEHGVEALADLAHLGRDGVALHAKMQIPVEIEIVVEIVPHERLPGELRVQNWSKNPITFS